MSGQFVLALDLGTSALKAGVLTRDGDLVAGAAASFGPVSAHDDGGAEGDALEWLEGMESVCRDLAATGSLDQVGAVVVSGHGPSLVAVDSEGIPLGPALRWLDRRAQAEAREVGRLWGREIDASYFLPKALWLSRLHPDRYRASRYLLSCPELLLHRLTGRAVTVLHTEAFRHYYWRDDVVAALGLDNSKLAPFVPPGVVVGRLRGDMRERLHLPADVPVVAGGPDFLMSLLGTGCVHPGEVCDRAGSSEGINLCSDREVTDPRLHCHPHLVRPYWNVAGMIPASGLAVDWIRSVSGRTDESHEELFEAIAAVPPGARGVHFRPFREGGGGGELLGLSLGHGYREMARAVVESVAMDIRRILTFLGENGLRPRAITVTGGQARLDRWSQIKADVTGLDVRVPRVRDAELVGGGAVGFTTLGVFPDLATAAGRMVARDRVFHPQAAAAARYDELYLRTVAQAGSSSSR